MVFSLQETQSLSDLKGGNSGDKLVSLIRRCAPGDCGLSLRDRLAGASGTIEPATQKSRQNDPAKPTIPSQVIPDVRPNSTRRNRHFSGSISLPFQQNHRRGRSCLHGCDTRKGCTTGSYRVSEFLLVFF